MKAIHLSDLAKSDMLHWSSRGLPSKQISERLSRTHNVKVSPRSVRRFLSAWRREEVQDVPETPYVAQRVAERAESHRSEFVKTPESVEYSSEVEGDPAQVLRDKGLDPAKWEISRVYARTLKDGSQTFGFSAVPKDGDAPVEEDWSEVENWRPTRETALEPSTGEPVGFALDIADNQIGKARTPDQVKDQLDLIFARIGRARDALDRDLQVWNVQEVGIGWLGDHVEGFVSQGGNSAWRTQMPLTTQIQIMRRIMRHTMLLFADVGVPVKMVSVPGNHSESVRFGGTGLTTYTDSHDTDCLIALWEHAKDNPELEHVSFHVPQDDELNVVVDIAGTLHFYSHGHKVKPGKHLEWWKGQAFDIDSPVHQATVAHFGHYHHLEVTTSGKRTSIVAPANEVESQWWKHVTGEIDPGGLVTTITQAGEVRKIEVVR